MMDMLSYDNDMACRYAQLVLNRCMDTDYPENAFDRGNFDMLAEHMYEMMQELQTEISAIIEKSDKFSEETELEGGKLIYQQQGMAQLLHSIFGEQAPRADGIIFADDVVCMYASQVPLAQIFNEARARLIPENSQN